MRPYVNKGLKVLVYEAEEPRPAVVKICSKDSSSKDRIRSAEVEPKSHEALKGEAKLLVYEALSY